MRTKTTPVLSTVLLLALGVACYFIYDQHKTIVKLEQKIQTLMAHSGDCCGDSVVPTYSSISYEEFDQNVKYFQSNIGTNLLETDQETKALWMSVSEMQNYLCVIRNHAKSKGLDVNDLGLRIYFIRYKPTGNEYDNKLSVAFIPTQKGARGESRQDFDASSLQTSTILGGGQTFIMNRIMPCPVNCDGVLLK